MSAVGRERELNERHRFSKQKGWNSANDSFPPPLSCPPDPSDVNVYRLNSINANGDFRKGPGLGLPVVNSVACFESEATV